MVKSAIRNIAHHRQHDVSIRLQSDPTENVVCAYAVRRYGGANEIKRRIERAVRIEAKDDDDSVSAAHRTGSDDLAVRLRGEGEAADVGKPRNASSAVGIESGVEGTIGVVPSQAGCNMPHQL